MKTIKKESRGKARNENHSKENKACLQWAHLYTQHSQGKNQ